MVISVAGLGQVDLGRNGAVDSGWIDSPGRQPVVAKIGVVVRVGLGRRRAGRYPRWVKKQVDRLRSNGGHVKLRVRKGGVLNGGPFSDQPYGKGGGHVGSARDAELPRGPCISGRTGGDRKLKVGQGDFNEV